MRRTDEGPAFYATGERGRWRDVRALLHPPYTAWHLSYVVLGAMTAVTVNWALLAWTVLAFFLAVGVSAHALDELRGRPLETGFSARSLWLLAVGGLVGAMTLGVVGIAMGRVSAWLVAFIALGAALVVSYNLELFGGLAHTDLGFALSWGAFPVLTSAFAQSGTVRWSAVVLAVAATLITGAQRALSTPVRRVRRRATSVEGRVTLRDGTALAIDRAALLGPSETALRYLSWAMVVLALAAVLARSGV